jgi:hypothetical protein
MEKYSQSYGDTDSFEQHAKDSIKMLKLLNTSYANILEQWESGKVSFEQARDMFAGAKGDFNLQVSTPELLHAEIITEQEKVKDLLSEMQIGSN